MKVHVVDVDGRLLYNRLWDKGLAVLIFDSGYGFLCRSDVERSHWSICLGWRG